MSENTAQVNTVKVDASTVAKLREWFAMGRGVRMWENADLSSGQVGRKTFTPADATTAPHWSLVDRGAILPQDITVETFTPRVTFRGTCKRRYWGMDVSDASRAKAERMKQEGETWVYTIGYDYGRTYATIEIGRMVETPFANKCTECGAQDIGEHTVCESCAAKDQGNEE